LRLLVHVRDRQEHSRCSPVDLCFYQFSLSGVCGKLPIVFGLHSFPFLLLCFLH
jgi:hypothetical protein